jgi:hypothetical protein
VSKVSPDRTGTFAARRFEATGTFLCSGAGGQGLEWFEVPVIALGGGARMSNVDDKGALVATIPSLLVGGGGVRVRF